MASELLIIFIFVVPAFLFYLNFKIRINPNHAFIVELINRFLK